MVRFDDLIYNIENEYLVFTFLNFFIELLIFYMALMSLLVTAFSRRNN